MTNHRMVTLLNSFPVMKALNIREWEGAFISTPERLPAIYAGASAGERKVIEFCLQVWNRDTDWTQFGYENFNVVAAWALWDDRQKDAFKTWIYAPFYP